MGLPLPTSRRLRFSLRFPQLVENCQLSPRFPQAKMPSGYLGTLELRDIFSTGEMGLHRELLKKYQPSMLELLKIPGLGPKSVSLIWDAFQVADIAGVEQLAKEHKLQSLPRMSAKTEEKIIKGIEDY